ncbi:MAG TPA: GlmU family protein, partial [Candidatus Kryptobacter bacterium]|nr:GlmU family protein [Candidatus Kryptobacter bacterium]
PLTHFRPAYDLRCGQTTLREKITRAYPDEIFVLHTRDYLRDTVKEKHTGAYVNEVPKDANRLLLINGRMLFTPEASHKFEYKGVDVAYVDGDALLAVWLSGENLEAYRNSIGKKLVSADDFAGIERKETKGSVLISYPWELVNRNGAELFSDFAALTRGQPGVLGKVYDGALLLNASQIHLGKGAKVKPGAVLDAEKGPIYIARDVEVMPHAFIRGPVFIGEGSMIKAGAKIYENTSIGEMCKVGGEVEDSIIHAHSNKQHEGFVGHSYLGEWVNIGAGSNTSDLKNDYGSVKVYNDGSMVDSGLQFVGLTMGDHSKCGINSMFNTGTVVSVCCNIFGTGSPPKYLPAFSWGEATSKFSVYRPDKAVEVARRVMERRNVVFTRADEELMKNVFELTVQERDAAGIRS